MPVWPRASPQAKSANLGNTPRVTQTSPVLPSRSNQCVGKASHVRCQNLRAQCTSVLLWCGPMASGDVIEVQRESVRISNIFCQAFFGPWNASLHRGHGPKARPGLSRPNLHLELGGPVSQNADEAEVAIITIEIGNSEQSNYI